MQCERPKTSFSFSFYKTQTHFVRSGMFSTRQSQLKMDMNYFKVQARLIINFNSNIVEPNTRLDDHLVITTIFFRFKRRNKTYFNFYLFEKSPVKATTSFLRPGFYGPTVVALTGFHCLLYDFRLRIETDLH